MGPGANADGQSGRLAVPAARRWAGIAIGMAATLMLLVGCARTLVQPRHESRAQGLPKPAGVLVYDFAVSAADVKENQGFFASVWNSGSADTQSDRERAIGRQVAATMTEDLVAGIRSLGLPAQRAKLGTPIPSRTLLVGGRFLNVDEGNRLHRVVIGFGAGGSQVDTRVELYYATGSERSKLLEFSTHADSGKMPGAAVTLGAGAAAQGGVTAGAAAANVAVGGVKVYRSDVENMAGRSAEQAVAYLSEYFAKQGWIAPDAAQKAKRADQ